MQLFQFRFQFQFQFNSFSRHEGNAVYLSRIFVAIESKISDNTNFNFGSFSKLYSNSHIFLVISLLHIFSEDEKIVISIFLLFSHTIYIFMRAQSVISFFLSLFHTSTMFIKKLIVNRRCTSYAVIQLLDANERFDTYMHHITSIHTPHIQTFRTILRIRYWQLSKIQRKLSIF